MPALLPTRRDFLQISSLALAGWVLPGRRRAQGFRFGMLADPHYADTDARGTRFYRQSLAKVRECVDHLDAEQVDFLIELGDFKDQDEPPVEADTLRYLATIEAELQRFPGPAYHVLGNHDMDSISKPQFLAAIDNPGVTGDASFYSFDRSDLHFVVLDACFRADGAPYDHGDFDWRDTNIPPTQLDWLAADLTAHAEMPTILFCHQRLDGEGDVFVNNADEARLLLRRRGNVIAAFHGHDHAGAHSEIDSIHYYTLRAVVEGSGPDNNSYAIVEVTPDGIAVTGYRRAVTGEFART
ncbi:MAG: metallophosphoesterase [Acidobacteriota bacterium]